MELNNFSADAAEHVSGNNKMTNGQLHALLTRRTASSQIICPAHHISCHRDHKVK